MKTNTGTQSVSYRFRQPLWSCLINNVKSNDGTKLNEIDRYQPLLEVIKWPQ